MSQTTLPVPTRPVYQAEIQMFKAWVRVKG